MGEGGNIKLPIDDDNNEKLLSGGIRRPSQTLQKHSSTRMITAVVAFYWITSLSVVFLNKFILSSSEFKFPYPLLVTWFQLWVALFLLVGGGHAGKRYFSLYHSSYLYAYVYSVKELSMIPPFEFDLNLASRVWPLTFVYVMMLALNNLCLKYVEVTFYQV